MQPMIMQAMTYSSATLPSGVCRLTDLGVIRVEGAEAAAFLHNQLTNDFSPLGMSEARLAAFCSAKGRMQASFIGFKRGGEEIWLICSRDLLAQTLKRLSMFVLRSKAKLSDITDTTALFGVTGNAIKNIADSAIKPLAKRDFDAQSWVQLLPADGVPRALVAQPADAPAPDGAALDPALWLWSEVRAGVAMVSLPVFEAFVPQMLNYESVGGVNFKKGCYPGQEVVARSQFRGTLKRRAYIVHADQPMAAGQEVFSTEDASQPVGLVVQAAAAPQGGFEAIVSMQTAAAQGGLALGGADGPAIKLGTLPYPLLEDI
jgi:tRNA-modifying protein YgfZ